jgi:hypothetical protein
MLSEADYGLSGSTHSRPGSSGQDREEDFEMASFVWLIVWLIEGTPDLEWFGSWNDWAVALLGCIIFDVFSGREAGSRRRR